MAGHISQLNTYQLVFSYLVIIMQHVRYLTNINMQPVQILTSLNFRFRPFQFHSMSYELSFIWNYAKYTNTITPNLDTRLMISLIFS